MIQLADSILRTIKKDAEVYIVKAEINAVYVDGSKISNIETKTDMGMSVRIADNNKLGKASVTLGDSGPEDCVKMALQASEYSPPNDDFKGFAIPSKKTLTPKGTIDKRIENIDPKGLMEIVSGIVDACDTDVPRGLLRVSTIESAVVNSNGVSAEHKSTMLYGHFTSMTKLEHPGEGIETLFGTSLDLDPVAIGESLCRSAKAAASAVPFKGKKELTMILPPSELGDMIMSSAGYALNGENVRYGRSLWKDDIGKEVASKGLTLTDDPMTPGPLCSSFDDEGTPSSKKAVIENGILKGFLNDSFAGGSTGNGMRRSSVESQGIYENTTSIKPMNLVLKKGNKTQQQIIEETDHGILIDKFAWPEADGLTGRFGLEVRSGYLIENGEIVKTINNALMMGNMITALKNIEMIGSDVQNRGCVTVPTVSFTGTELIGN